MFHRRKSIPPRRITHLQIEPLEPRMTLSAHPLAALVHGHHSIESHGGHESEAVAAMIAQANVLRAHANMMLHARDADGDADAGEKEGQETATFTQTNLVSNTAAIPAAHQDANLVNPWGIAMDKATGMFWVADNGSGKITQYDSAGVASSLVITVPSPTAGVNGTPTGLVLNSGTKFALKDGSPSTVIVATEDGTIAAWGPSLTNDMAQIVVDNSASGAVYKGLAMARVGGKTYLYATDFHHGTVDVFDTTFNKVTSLPGKFTDPGTVPLPPLPAGAIGYAPFGISNIRGKLYVTYAAQDSAGHDDVKGAGAGFIDVFNPNGTFVRRLATGGTLNAPWGLATIEEGFRGDERTLIVGNFGDGTLNAFALGSGKFLGQLTDSTGAVIKIDGLWGLALSAAEHNGRGDREGHKQEAAIDLFFAAGPNDETSGLFGKLTATLD